MTADVQNEYSSTHAHPSYNGTKLRYKVTEHRLSLNVTQLFTVRQSTNLWLFQSRYVVHPLCRDVVINPVRRRRAEELFCFNHVLQTGMKELELCLVHRPENITYSIKFRLWKNTCLKTVQTQVPYRSKSTNLSRYASSSLKG